MIDTGATGIPSDAGKVPEAVRSPAETVLAQDQCFRSDGVDVDTWRDTVFFPLFMVSCAGTVVIADGPAFADHLRELHGMGLDRGMTGIRTRILSEITPAPRMALVRSLRDHIGAGDSILTTASITWTLIQVANEWRINQIHFNDSRQDPSVVSDFVRKKERKE